MQISHIDPERRRLLTTSRAQRDGGYILVMFAMLLIPLLLMVGFAVDVGYWYNRSSDMQKAADAAALAGVVWLPDEAKARTAALEAARKNGFDNSDPNISVTVNKSSKAPRRLEVKIRDDRVGSFVYSQLGGKDIEMGRTAWAEYVTAVPMGSPRNYFGTGQLLQSDPELLYLAINSYCTRKEQGDRHQVGNIGQCADTANHEYWPQGYEMYIEAPAGRSSPIEVRLYDARFNLDPISRSSESGYCPPYYSGSWTTQSGSSNITITGPRQYQTRSSSSSNWSSTQEIGPGQTFTFRRDRIRHRSPDTNRCASIDAGARMDSGSTSVDEEYTFSLYEADSTPLDDTDNDLKCQRTFERTTPYQGYSYLGSSRWNTLCTIEPGDPSGRYILRVQNEGTSSDSAVTNQYGVVARYTTASGNGLCDGRTDTTCPRVYGKEAISVYANTFQGVADFFLAEIEPQHDGKKLRIELFDPGEGGSEIEILRPSGPNSWTPTSVSWTSDHPSYGSGSGVKIDVSGSRFNGRLLVITVDLDGYNPPTNNNWWKIRYTFNDPARRNVTDRTTWSAKILGDPVHLVEET